MRPPLHWLGHRVGLVPADTQVSPVELACLLQYAQGRRSAVEIGVYHGASTRRLREVLAPDGHLTGIDPHPTGRLGVSFERAIALAEVSRARGASVRLARGMSTEIAARWTTPLDFLFVDGDHTWTGIESDWQAWRPWMALGGYVALHDSMPVPGLPSHESERFTQEVILRDPAFRLVTTVESLSIVERIADDAATPARPR